MLFSSKCQQIYIEKRIFSLFVFTIERKSDIRNDMVKSVYLRYFETKSKQQWIPLAFIVSRKKTKNTETIIITFLLYFFFFIFICIYLYFLYLLCSSKDSKFYSFGGWVYDDRMSIFGWDINLIITLQLLLKFLLTIWVCCNCPRVSGFDSCCINIGADDHKL